MKNKFFAILLVLALSLPISVWAVGNAGEDLIEPNTTQSVLEEEVEVVAAESTNQYKQPISKKKIAKKFLAAMGGVAASSFIIFFLLTLYNRVREEYLGETKIIDDEASLKSPDNMTEAVKTFLEKTKW